MKKILALTLGLLVLTGCGNKNMTENYDNMNIGTNIDSYQLDLRVYGTNNGTSVNKMYKIDNYKNEQFTINTSDATYYVLNGKTYKTTNDTIGVDRTKYVTDDSINSEYQVVDESIFHNTDIFLQGLNNIKTKETTDNDMSATGDYTVYNITLKDSYVKDLLKELGFSDSYTDCSGKAYIDKDNNIYRIIYKIDSLTLNGAFFRINSINELNINQFNEG